MDLKNGDWCWSILKKEGRGALLFWDKFIFVVFYDLSFLSLMMIYIAWTSGAKVCSAIYAPLAQPPSLTLVNRALA